MVVARMVPQQQQLPQAQRCLCRATADTERLLPTLYAQHHKAMVQVLQAPRGRACQMNEGAASAKGPWLLFMHADCWLSAR